MRFPNYEPTELLAGIDRGKVLMPTRPTKLFVPPVVAINDGRRVRTLPEEEGLQAGSWLVWSLAAETEEDNEVTRPVLQAVTYPPDLLDRFARLRKGESRLLSFAERFGPLNTLSAEHMAWLRGDHDARMVTGSLRRSGDLWPRLRPATTEDGIPAVAERIADWQRASRVINQSLRLAGLLCVLDRRQELPWTDAEALGFVWGGEYPAAAQDLPLVSIDDSGAQITIKGDSRKRKTRALRGFLGWLLYWGFQWLDDDSPDLPRLRFAHDFFEGGTIEPYVTVRSLRGALGLQLSFALARANRQVRCEQCGDFFEPARRTTKRYTHRHCGKEACRRKYLAQRKQIERSRARGPEEELNSTPASTP